MHRSLALLRDRTRRPRFVQLTVRLRKPCHRRCSSSYRVASFARSRSMRMNPSIVSRWKKIGKKKDYQRLPSLQNILPDIQYQLFHRRFCISFHLSPITNMSRIRPSNDTYIAEQETKQSSEIVEWKSFRSKIFRAEILIEVAALDATLGETKKIRSTREGRSTYTLYAYIRSHEHGIFAPPDNHLVRNSLRLAETNIHPGRSWPVDRESGITRALVVRA